MKTHHLLKVIWPWVIVLSFMVAGSSGGKPAAWGQERIPSFMEQDPAFRPIPYETYFPNGLRELWLKALNRPEAEMKVRAADAFSAAIERGYTDLEGVGPLLLEQFEKSEHLTVRLACAKALVRLDYQTSADAFVAAINTVPLSIAQVIEPALANWGNSEAESLWLKRLTTENWQVETRVLAIHCLAITKNEKLLPEIESLVLNQSQHSQLRIAAAQAMAKIRPNGNLAILKTLSQQVELERQPHARLVGRLISVNLLEKSTSTNCLPELHRMATDEVSAISLKALSAIARLDRQELKQHLPAMIESGDVGIRTIAGEWHLETATPESVAVLLDLMNDPNPTLRERVGTALAEFAKSGRFTDQILSHSSNVIETADSKKDWRKIEQALKIIVACDHKPAAQLMTSRLGAARPEVSITTAWALSKLRVPETFPAMLEYAQAVYDSDVGGISATQDEIVSHLFQGLALGDYREAEPLMRDFVPKQIRLRYLSRAAAIWGLGLFYQEALDSKLAFQLDARLNDRDSQIPEVPWVRHMAANALGRMKAEAHLDSLKASAFLDGMRDPVGQSSAWAVHRITGEPIPPVPPMTSEYRGWFLEPVQASDATIE